MPTAIVIVGKDVKSRIVKEHYSKQSSILRVAFSSKRNEKFSAVHSLRPEKQDGIVHQLFTTIVQHTGKRVDRRASLRQQAACGGDLSSGGAADRKACHLQR